MKKLYLCALAASVLLLLAGCGGGGGGGDTPTETPTNTPPPNNPVSTCDGECFPNGVAAGDVDQSSVVLWAKPSFTTGNVRFEYGQDPTFSSSPEGFQDEGVTDTNIPAKVEISGLRPGTQYYYRACRGSCPVSGLPDNKAWGSFRTPHAAGSHGLRFGVSSCFEGSMKPFVSIKNVPNENLDFFVALGDTVYADSSRYNQAKSLNDFRKYYRDNLGDNYLALARASTAFYVDIDDHEVTDNFAGGAHPTSHGDTQVCHTLLAGDDELLKDRCLSFCDPDPKKADPNCKKNFINETDTYTNALKAWHEYNPVLKDEKYGETGDPRTANKRKLYRYRTFGTDAAMFMLDARSFRDEPIPSDPFTDKVTLPHLAYNKGRTMLGSAQLDDLLDDLQDAQTRGITWKFVLVPEPIQALGNAALADRFEGYAYERAVLLDYIESFCITNVVFISGDIHGTITNNLTYDKGISDLEAYSAAWDISTGPVAYDPPFGPQWVQKNIIPDAFLYNSKSRNEQNHMIEVQMNIDLSANADPQVGLYPFESNPTFLHQENADTPVTLLDGSYTSTNTFGWTAFEVDATTKNLTVTTWGITWYDKSNRTSTNVLNSTPIIVSKFVVRPKISAGDGDWCTGNKDCSSCRCSFLKCVARLENGSVCIINEQCKSDRCSFGTCKDKAPDGGDCANDTDCKTGTCSDFLCRPSPNDSTCGDDGTSLCVCSSDSDCLSGRCTLLGGNNNVPVCRASLPNDSDCLNDYDCASGRCSDFICKPKKVNSSDCRNNNDCLSGNCSDFLCRPSTDYYTCGDDGTSLCVCSSDRDCASGRCSSFVCKPKETNGSECRNNNDCVSDICSGFRCVATIDNRPNGAGCTLDSQCSSDHCTDFVCKDKEGIDGDCLNNNDCQSGRCSALKCKARESGGSRCVLDEECISNNCESTYCKAPLCRGPRRTGCCKARNANCSVDWECCSTKFNACSFGKCN